MIAACAEVLRQHSLKCLVGEVTDIVGTGGDGHDTFNVSTAAAMVAAACGLRVAKVCAFLSFFLSFEQLWGENNLMTAWKSGVVFCVWQCRYLGGSWGEAGAGARGGERHP